MANVRRWYVYLAAGITLQAVTWAGIALLRNLLIPDLGADEDQLALQIAVLVVGLPLYLAHWIWAQRTAAGDPEERESIPRALYLYAMLAAFLAPAVANLYSLAKALFNIPSGRLWSDPNTGLEPGPQIAYCLLALIALALLFAYHRRAVQVLERRDVENEPAAIIRQVYQYGFCAAGLAMTVSSVYSLLRWLLINLFPAGVVFVPGMKGLLNDLALLLVGAPLWLFFWTRTQRAFRSGERVEQESAVRKIYLYLTLFLSVLGVVVTAAIVFADIIGGWLGVQVSRSEAGIREPLAIVIAAGVVWAYHGYILRQDERAAGEPGQAALVRRIYVYLMTGIGLAAVLVGLGGILSVLIRASAGEAGLSQGLRRDLANFIAALAAGLPVWLVNWRSAQAAVKPSGEPQADEERSSFVRSLYLYAFIFAATLTVLGCAIYIVSQVVEWILGARGGFDLVEDLGQAIAYALIAVGVWLYHGAVLRGDRRALKEMESRKEAGLFVVILGLSGSQIPAALKAAIEARSPGARVEALAVDQPGEESLAALRDADAIFATSDVFTDNLAGHPDLAARLAESRARRYLLPLSGGEWRWLGNEPPEIEKARGIAASAVEDLAAGKEPRPPRRLGALAIVVITLIGLCVLGQILTAVMNLFL